MICAVAGLVLEEACQELSWRILISVLRRRGDRYSLGDLWPGIRKILSKTSAASAAGRVDQWWHLRNLVGAHYNEWSVNLSLHEAKPFGESGGDLVEATRCPDCGEWLVSERLICSRSHSI